MAQPWPQGRKQGNIMNTITKNEMSNVDGGFFWIPVVVGTITAIWLIDKGLDMAVGAIDGWRKAHNGGEGGGVCYVD
jgi:hypothetical protein